MKKLQPRLKKEIKLQHLQKKVKKEVNTKASAEAPLSKEDLKKKDEGEEALVKKTPYTPKEKLAKAATEEAVKPKPAAATEEAVLPKDKKTEKTEK